VDARDQLTANAVERLGQAASLASDAAVITCDEDVKGPLGRAAPRLRPGPSPDFLLESDVAGGLICVRRDRLDDVEAEGAWQYGLALRLAGPDGGGQAHVPAVLRHARHPARGPEDHAHAARAVLQTREASARIDELSGGRRQVRRELTGEPSVEIVILFRDRAALLRRCVESLLRETAYEHFSLHLVDNGSEESETSELLDRLERHEQVRVTRDDRPFNFAALNNVPARGSTADFLLFLNNDTEVIAQDWLELLLEHAQRPQVGAVAPLLLYGDGKVQHAGAALGLHDYAGHPFAGLNPDRATPFGSATDGTRNWLAVTAACMLVERRKFEEVGGFDESFVVAGNDVDLCLRLTRSGYRSLCVSHARMLHHEGRSRGDYIDPGDFERSQESYGEFRTIGDPFYNPALTLRRSDCGLRGADEL
jgi:GT2 family glycosyltransferase